LVAFSASVSARMLAPSTRDRSLRVLMAAISASSGFSGAAPNCSILASSMKLAK
jgi:hypothetical protein